MRTLKNKNGLKSKNKLKNKNGLKDLAYECSIRRGLATRGYFSIRSFCLAKNVNYNNFLRGVTLGVLKLSDIEEVSIKLGLTESEVVEFFLPNVFENLKQNEVRFEINKQSI